MEPVATMVPVPRVNRGTLALVLLAGALLTPGSEAIVVGQASDGVVVKTAAGERTIPTRLAELMFVTPAA